MIPLKNEFVLLKIKIILSSFHNPANHDKWHHAILYSMKHKIIMTFEVYRPISKVTKSKFGKELPSFLIFPLCSLLPRNF